MVLGQMMTSNTCQKNHTMDDRTNCLKVFVQRDYSEGTNVKFQSKLPPELEGRIDKATFENTISTLNGLYAEGEKASCSVFCESCLACFTAYLTYICMESHYEKNLKRIAAFIQEENENIYAPKGLMLVDPIERGLRVIEITVLNELSTNRS